MQEGNQVIVAVHDSYRLVVAVCDEDVQGRMLREGKRVLDVGGRFFQGTLMSVQQAKEEMERYANEDATFNIVGKNSVAAALELGLIDKQAITSLEGVPFALVLM